MSAPKPEKTGVKPPENEEEDSSLGCSGYLGIVLLAGALFNVPAIMKVPETTADKMMLVIVIAMAVGGAVLLIARLRNKR